VEDGQVLGITHLPQFKVYRLQVYHAPGIKGNEDDGGEEFPECVCLVDPEYGRYPFLGVIKNHASIFVKLSQAGTKEKPRMYSGVNFVFHWP
jgi:hypothetical protein